MTNTVTIGQACAFIERHSLKPRLTADGILVKAWATVGKPTSSDVLEGLDDDDIWFEELQVFPMHNNTVDLAPIKAWLGY